MSLLINSNQDQIAYITNRNGVREGTLSFIESQDGIDSIELDEGFTFQLAPRSVKEKERMTLFVAGEAGAGKSHFIREYAKKYHKMFPDNPMYLISKIQHLMHIRRLCGYKH